MKILFIAFILLVAGDLFGQPLRYNTSNVHSHNDYEQKIPFWLAYKAGLGSMEADIFLQDGELLVAHEEEELLNHRTLEEYYLRNLQHCMEKNGNHPYADTSRKLQVLIEIKTDSITTLNKLVEVLKKYPDLIGSPSITFVITGRLPEPSAMAGFPSFIYFDGVLSKTYNEQAQAKIILMSDDFKTYSQWDGTGPIPQKDRAILQAAVDKAHRYKKLVRFWDAPDFMNAWQQFMRLGVDYINTDHIREIAAFLQQHPE